MLADVRRYPSQAYLEIEELTESMAKTAMPTLSSFAVQGRLLTQAQVVAELRRFLALFAAANRAREVHTAAIAARVAADIEMRQSREGVISQVRNGVGPRNTALLAGFGSLALGPRGRTAGDAGPEVVPGTPAPHDV